jgi:hypothetical protein
MSVRWIRVATALAMASTFAVAAILLPAIGALGAGVVLLLIASIAVRIAEPEPPMTAVIAGIDAEPLAARAPAGRRTRS